MKYKFILAIFLLSLVNGANSQTLSSESKILARCEFIYSYVSQLMQIKNNAGAAVNILRRSSMMSAANMISNATDGNIPGWKIKIWTELRPALKDSLDSKKLDPVAETARCDQEAMPIALKVRDQNLQLWGYDFDGLQQQFLAKMRVSTGI